MLFMLFIFPFIGFAQIDDYITFDYYYSHVLYRDTLANPNCIWQVGFPQKSVFTPNIASPNAIMTDTLNPYPINDTSSFIIKHAVGEGFLCPGPSSIGIVGDYFVNSDSLYDFGIIEFSPDNGATWVSITSDTDPLPNFNPLGLTGNSTGWKQFNIPLGVVKNMYNFESFDTVQFKFTFISDDVFDNLDGLMFDNIKIKDNDCVLVGNNEIQEQNSNTYPNPFTTNLNLNYEHLTKGKLFIYDMTGKLVHSEIIKNTNSTTVNTSEFTKGIYFYKIVDSKTGLNVSRGKIVK